MTTIADTVKLLEQIAPPELAEEWDNVGLLAGDPARKLDRVMTCLTLTPNVATEAIEHGANLIVTHHPLPFHPLQQITTKSIEGDSLWRLIGAGVAIYSAHTAYDSAAAGINQQWAEGLELSNIKPFAPPEPPRDDNAGVGRIGEVASPDFDNLVAAVKRLVAINSVRVVRPAAESLKQVAIACGSGGSLLSPAIAAGAELLITGEMTFHDCLRAEANGVGLLLTGHYASERFAMEQLAVELGKQLTSVEVWASLTETDPLSAA